MRIKRIFVGLLASAFSISAYAATLNPIQLLNPAGSAAGNAIVSTGPSTAPAWGPVTLSGITGTLAIANGGTGQTSAAAALTALGGLSTTAAASTYLTQTNATSTYLTQANATSTYATITNLALKAPLASPTFTGTVNAAAITASGLITPTSTIGIKATATNDNPQSGSVGEYPIATVLTNTAITLATATNLCTLPLTPGDWDVTGNAYYTSGTTITQLITSVSQTSATQAGAPYQTQQAMSLSSGQVFTQAPMTTRVSIASGGNAYLVGFVNGTGSPTYQCILRARRPR